MITYTRRERVSDAVGARSVDNRPRKRRREVDEFDDMKQALSMQEMEDPMLAGEYSDSIFSYMRELEPEILVEYSGYSFSEMEPAVLDMISFLSENYVTRTAPFHKYKTRRRSFVSLLVARWIERRSHIHIL
ncbi:hypothetical protein BGZ97_011210 [Linnemannia gamsii]|uniref:Uncharacterized protein n=1 Tax=Linnemannia gamsii TaxID=64522 RepID=A0A9P6R8C1_9FUNG|nr:hypothetical protein BGZ97_011210 [Linnemannia gamsii]